MSYKVSWNGPKVLEFFKSRMQRRVLDAADVVAAHARQLASIPYPPASRPGHPAHMRTGLFRASIRAEAVRGGRLFGRFYARVVSDVSYAGYLEHGTSRMKARPTIARALADKRNEVERIMRGR